MWRHSVWISRLIIWTVLLIMYLVLWVFRHYDWWFRLLVYLNWTACLFKLNSLSSGLYVWLFCFVRASIVFWKLALIWKSSHALLLLPHQALPAWKLTCFSCSGVRKYRFYSEIVNASWNSAPLKNLSLFSFVFPSKVGFPAEGKV